MKRFHVHQFSTDFKIPTFQHIKQMTNRHIYEFFWKVQQLMKNNDKFDSTFTSMLAHLQVC